MTYDSLYASMRLYAVPQNLRDAVARYITHGTEPGGFVQAVLQNDLKSAVVRAGVSSKSGLVDLVMWLIAEAPESCWGSSERYRDWIAHNGQERV
jgi:hypothetical protein